MLPFLKIMMKNLLSGPSTEAFPFAPAHTPKAFRGKAQHDKDKCILCGICRHVCAAGAIQMRVAEDGLGVEYVLWHNSCVFCGLCAHYCPTKALTMSNDWHLSHRGEERFQVREESFVRYGKCASCGARIQPRPAVIVEKLGAANPGSFLLCPICKRAQVAQHLAPPQEALSGETLPEAGADDE